MVVFRCLVVFVELIQFDDSYKLLGVCRARGIAATLQSVGPRLVVVLAQREKTAVARLPCEQQTVVFVTLIYIVVGPETFLPLVIVNLCKG